MLTLSQKIALEQYIMAYPVKMDFVDLLEIISTCKDKEELIRNNIRTRAFYADLGNITIAHDIYHLSLRIDDVIAIYRG